MTAAKLREDMAARIAELRAIPADPEKRARLLDERIKGITGCQDEQAACWMCGAVRSLADMRRAGGGEYACAEAHEQGCVVQAAEYDDEEFAYEAARGRGDCGGI